MKKQILAMVAGLMTLQAQAGMIPDGAYKGNGMWRSAQSNGIYQVRTAVAGTKVSADYVMPDGTQKSWNFEIVTREAGQFKVVANTVQIGHGYCLEKVNVCHYEISVSDFSLEETLTLSDKKLYRFGSKTSGQGRTLWQESMDQE